MTNIFIKIRQWHWKRKAKRGIVFLEELDDNLKKAGYSRTQRKRFWREFVKKKQFRGHLFKDLKEIRFGKDANLVSHNK